MKLAEIYRNRPSKQQFMLETTAEEIFDNLSGGKSPTPQIIRSYYTYKRMVNMQAARRIEGTNPKSAERLRRKAQFADKELATYSTPPISADT